MLLFSTVLYINEKLTRESFVKLVLKWNEESKYKKNVVEGVQWHGEYNIRWGTDLLWLSIQEYKEGNLIAVRHEKTEDDGSVWDTDFVMNFHTRKMAVRLDRSYTPDAISTDPRFSTPHFITLLERGGYLKDDNSLPVTREPIIITENNLSLLFEVINGTASYKLPVIYISKTINDEDPVDAARLASSLKGVGHVLVQQTKQTNKQLREACNDNNEYFGAVGIYFPNKATGHKRYIYRISEGYDERITERVVTAVIQYCNSLMIEPNFTWQGVNNALLLYRFNVQKDERLAAENARRKAEEEKTDLLNALDEEEKRIKRQAIEEAEKEANKILDGFDNEMQKLKNQVEELARENEKLQYENQGLRSRLDALSGLPVLCMGDEFEFYPGEIKDLILLVLSESATNMSDGTRRADIVNDIIGNNDYRGISENHAQEVKRLLKSYTGMTAPLKQALEDMGFVINEDGKHYKLTYYGDDRYQIILSKTPSDVRTGKNSAQKLNKTVF